MRIRKRNKYNANKIKVDGFSYDSTLEAARYRQLTKLQQMGLIEDLKRQTSFVLQEAFVDNHGYKRQARFYVSDFDYKVGGVHIVEDVKGYISTRLDCT